MVVKILRIVDAGLALVAVVLGCVALAGVSEDKDTIESVHWSKIVAGGSDYGYEVSGYYNLWGGIAELDVDEDFADYYGVSEYALERELGAAIGLPFDEPIEVDYDEQDAMYALVIIGFVLAVLKLIVAIGAIAIEYVRVGVGSTILSLLGIAFWFAALGLWVDEVMDGVDDEEGVDLSYGPGLGCAAACGSLAVISLVLSVAALVVGSILSIKEGGAKYGGSPARDVEMAATG